MKTYRVEYRIDIDATSPEAAAEIANTLSAEQDARYWTVIDEHGDECTVLVNSATSVAVETIPA